LKEVDSQQSLLHWVTNAKKGEKAVYYDGLLMMDRSRYFLNGGLVGGEPEKIRAANFAWRLYEDGLVNLIQKKKKAYSYDYIAIKR
jgi:hypothetical protein